MFRRGLEPDHLREKRENGWSFKARRTDACRLQSGRGTGTDTSCRLVSGARSLGRGPCADRVSSELERELGTSDPNGQRTSRGLDGSSEFGTDEERI